MPTTHTETLFDVAILGTGIGGTSLGAILAKNGLRVLLLEQTVHPRFAIGESTVPVSYQSIFQFGSTTRVPAGANGTDRQTQQVTGEAHRVQLAKARALELAEDRLGRDLEDAPFERRCVMRP